MKNKLIILTFNSFLFLVLICSKELNGQNTTTTVYANSTEYHNMLATPMKSLINPDNVVMWLNKGINSYAPHKKKIIQNILTSIDTCRMYVEKLHSDENLIIIPLFENYFSNHARKKDNPIQYLLLVENSTHSIRRGDLVIFYPKDSKISLLPKNSFYSFFNSESISVDGTFTLITLGDVKQYEMDFHNGDKTFFRLWLPKKSKQLNCADWYLETTNFNDFMHYNDLDCIEYNSAFLGTSCLSCPPGEICDPLTNAFWE